MAGSASPFFPPDDFTPTHPENRRFLSKPQFRLDDTMSRVWLVTEAQRARQRIHDLQTLLDVTRYEAERAEMMRASIKSSYKSEFGDPRTTTLSAQVIEGRSPEVNRRLTLSMKQGSPLRYAKDLRLSYPNDRVAIVNFADPDIPGGRLLNGGIGGDPNLTSTQESMLCYQTNLYQTLRREFFTLKDHEVVFSPKVVVVQDPSKHDLQTEWKHVANGDWFDVDVISVSAAGIRGPHGGTGQRRRHLRPEAQVKWKKVMTQRLELIFRAAVKCEVHCIVMSVWCDHAWLFRNPAMELAALIRNLLIGQDKNLPNINWPGLGLRKVVLVVQESSLDNKHPVWNDCVQGWASVLPPSGEMDQCNTNDMSYDLLWPLVVEKGQQEATTCPPPTHTSGLNTATALAAISQGALAHVSDKEQTDEHPHLEARRAQPQVQLPGAYRELLGSSSISNDSSPRRLHGSTSTSIN